MGQLGLVAVAAAFLLAAMSATAQIPLTGQTGQTGQTAAPSTRSSTQKTLSEPEAKRKIEKSGYKEVTDLKRDGGTWKARAKKKGKNVSVLISRTGKVSEGKRSAQLSGKTTPR